MWRLRDWSQYFCVHEYPLQKIIGEISKVLWLLVVIVAFYKNVKTSKKNHLDMPEENAIKENGPHKFFSHLCKIDKTKFMPKIPKRIHFQCDNGTSASVKIKWTMRVKQTMQTFIFKFLKWCKLSVSTWTLGGKGYHDFLISDRTHYVPCDKRGFEFSSGLRISFQKSRNPTSKWFWIRIFLRSSRTWTGISRVLWRRKFSVLKFGFIVLLLYFRKVINL